jgi:hypothetical protein
MGIDTFNVGRFLISGITYDQTVNGGNANGIDNNPLSVMSAAEGIEEHSSGGADPLFADITNGSLSLQEVSGCLYDNLGFSCSSQTFAIAANLTEEDATKYPRSINNDMGGLQRKIRGAGITGKTIEDTFFAPDGTLFHGRLSPIHRSQYPWRASAEESVSDDEMTNTAGAPAGTWTDCSISKIRLHCRVIIQTALAGASSGPMFRYQSASSNVYFKMRQLGGDPTTAEYGFFYWNGVVESVIGTTQQIGGLSAGSKVILIIEDDGVDIKGYVDDDGTPLITVTEAQMPVPASKLVGYKWFAQPVEHHMDQYRVESL